MEGEGGTCLKFSLSTYFEIINMWPYGTNISTLVLISRIVCNQSIKHSGVCVVTRGVWGGGGGVPDSRIEGGGKMNTYMENLIFCVQQF
jgi:hypothetical protein